MPQRDPSGEDVEKIDRLRRAMYSRSLSPKLKDRERRAFDPEENALPDDWNHEDEELPKTMVAPRGITLIRSALWWLLTIAIIFFACAVLFFIYYFTVGGGSTGTSPSNISIVVSGPPQIQSGSQTELEVSITNHNSVPLQGASLVVTYPDGTRSATDYTTSLPDLEQDLGTIAPNQTKQGVVYAVFNGTQGSPGDVKVELQYQLNGSNSTFTADSDYAFTYSSSPISIVVTGDSQAISGQPFQITATISSNATAPINDLLLQATLPFGFNLTSTSPSVTNGNLWQLGTLSPGQKDTVTLTGVLTGEEGDNRVFNFSAGTRSSAASSTVQVPLATSQLPVTISQPFLGLAVAVNGSTSTVSDVAPGDRVNVSISYVNNLSSTITGATVVAKLSGEPIVGTSTLSENGFYRSSDNTILWNQTTDPDLASIAPGATGVLTFSFQVPEGSTLQGVSSPTIGMSINAAGNPVAVNGVPQTLQSVAQRTIAIASNLQFSATALYANSPYGQTGPLPPQANTETRYAIVFSLTNTTNTIQNAVLTAAMPPYVRYTGKCSPASVCDPSTGKLSFNSTNGTITWDIGDIPPGVGVDGTSPDVVAFEVGFTPSTSQVGETPTLLQNISLTGTDESTQQEVNLKARPDITTNLNDPALSDPNMQVSTDPNFSGIKATVVQ